MTFFWIKIQTILFTLIHHNTPLLISLCGLIWWAKHNLRVTTVKIWSPKSKFGYDKKYEFATSLYVSTFVLVQYIDIKCDGYMQMDRGTFLYGQPKNLLTDHLTCHRVTEIFKTIFSMTTAIPIWAISWRKCDGLTSLKNHALQIFRSTHVSHFSFKVEPKSSLEYNTITLHQMHIKWNDNSRPSKWNTY